MGSFACSGFICLMTISAPSGRKLRPCGQPAPWPAHFIRAVVPQAAAEVIKAPAEGPVPERRQQHLVLLHSQDGLLSGDDVTDGTFGGL